MPAAAAVEITDLVKRYGGRPPSTACPLPSPADGCWRCWARTAPARRPPSRSAKASAAPTPAWSGCSAWTPSPTPRAAPPGRGDAAGRRRRLTPGRARCETAAAVRVATPRTRWTPPALLERLGPGRRGGHPGTGGCPAASSSGSRWRWRWSAVRNWCSSTSRPPAWTRRPGAPPGTLDRQAARATASAVVLTTHFLDEAERLADHVVIIDAGRVVAAGSPAELTAAGVGGPAPVPGPGLPCDSRSCRPAAGRRAVSEPPPAHYLVAGDGDARAAGHARPPGARPRDVLAEDAQRRAAQPGGRLPRPHRPSSCRRPAMTAASSAGAAARPRGRAMLAAQTAMELRLMLRNGEQVAAHAGDPAAAAVVLQPAAAVLPLRPPAGASTSWCPAVLALAVMSAAFTGLAIGTGFERKYGGAQAAGRHRAAAVGAAARQDPRGAGCSKLLQAVLICAVRPGAGLAPARRGRCRRPC